MLWLRASAQREAALAEAHRAEAEAQRQIAIAQSEQARYAATPDARLTFELEVVPDGNMSVDGEKIELHELRVRLAKLLDETSNAFSVHINTDPECPVRHIIPVVEVCEDVGDVEYRIVASKESDVSADHSKTDE